MRSIVRIAILNISILIGVYVTLFTTSTVINKAKDYFSPNTADPRTAYPTFSSANAAESILRLSDSLPFEYFSFVGWRHKPFRSSIVNITSKGFRLSSRHSYEDSVWFFGGSTMWGYGVGDSDTIPSQFGDYTDQSVLNAGESNWGSRQGLNHLISLLGNGHKPSAIVFYDGVNDVAHQCRSEFDVLPVHSHESLMRQFIKGESLLKRLFQASVKPFVSLIGVEKPATDTLSYYDCHVNPKKSAAVAHHLILNWETAYRLARARGIKFRAIVQPTVFTTMGTHPLYFSAQERRRFAVLSRQYNAVYPHIRLMIANKCREDLSFCDSIIDGSEWLRHNSNEPLFFDFCHLGRIGNMYISKKLAQLL